MSCKRSAKTQLPAVASNSHRGLPQRLSKRCLALIIPRIKQAYATHQLKLLKLKKTKSRSTKSNSKSTQVHSKLRKKNVYWATHKRSVNFSHLSQGNPRGHSTLLKGGGPGLRCRARLKLWQGGVVRKKLFVAAAPTQESVSTSPPG